MVLSACGVASLSRWRLSKAHTLRGHSILVSQSATRTSFFASPKKEAKKGDPGAPSSAVPSISREPNDKAVCLTPSFGALRRDLKPQLNERGTASTPNLNGA